MELMVIGASRGLGRALVEGLPRPGDTVTGVSRSRPMPMPHVPGVTMRWIEADLAQPIAAAQTLEQQAPAVVDTLICNVGIWEAEAFSPGYDFLEQSDATTLALIDVNVSSTILILKRLLPRLLASTRPRLILTGSTSALPGHGRPEVAFGASKAALNGIASALREGFRQRHLGVTVLQLGYLNTEDTLAVPLEEAARRGQGAQVPVHDVVTLVRAVLDLSPASYVRELVLPAIGDARF
jgi:NAD(P)-dependent dehydrogenase (short-subunit alcohol dehydrogenase family)